MYKNTNLDNIDAEKWLPVVEYEGFYEVSCFGRIKSLKRKRVPSNKILSQINHSAGYLSVALSDSVKVDKKLCHILVAEAFVKKTNPNYVVNHKDGNKKNNIASNLEWGTSKHNSQEAIRLGLFTNFCENHHSSIFTNKQVSNIFESNESVIKLAQRYNTSTSTIYGIKSGRVWGNVTKKKHSKHIYKLNRGQVLKIVSDKRMHKEICVDYNINKCTVTQIKLGLIYSNITGIRYKSKRRKRQDA